MTTLATAGRQLHARAHEGGRVVVGVDDSPGGLTALRWAVRLARSRGAQLVAVRVWGLGQRRHGGHRGPGNGRGHLVLAFEGAEHREVAANLTERAFRAAGDVPDDLDVIFETPEGNPGPVLTGIATRAGDVLVVGSAGGHRAERAVHGSVSAYCARHARCPVTVVVASRPGTLADRLQAPDNAGYASAPGLTMATNQR
jgi:nucleotide-binding universal stress UspA family protein